VPKRQPNIYIGYDSPQQIAYDVCEFSISEISHIEINKLSLESLPEYSRDWGEIQSTEFTFTRFLVPYLNNYEGYSIFCDCDFLFLEDPLHIMKHVDPFKAISVVQHPRYLVNGETKMDNRPQHNAHRKNWASLIVFNNSHPSCMQLTPDRINNHPKGIDFHELSWVMDEEIGSLPMEWNCLDQYYHLETPKAIHYTDGGPWQGYTKTRYASLWTEQLSKLHNVQRA